MADFGDFFNYLRNSVNSKKIPINEEQLFLLGNMSPEEWNSSKKRLPFYNTNSWKKPGDFPGTPSFAPTLREPNPPFQLPPGTTGPQFPIDNEPRDYSMPGQSTTTKIPTPPTQKDSMMDYWKQPAFGGRFGIKMPRDQFVTIMGMLANSIAPYSAGGRMGANLAQLGGSMYGERMRREEEEPMRSLNQRLKEMQIGRMEKEKYQPLGGGVVQDLETGELLSLEKGGTLYERDPEAWEKMKRLEAEIKGKEPGQTLEDFEKKEQIKAKYRKSGTEESGQIKYVYNKDGTMRHRMVWNPKSKKLVPLIPKGQKSAWEPVPKGKLGEMEERLEKILREESGGKATTGILPQGLDEETIQFNMKKYGKSREEVINKYKEKYGAK